MADLRWRARLRAAAFAVLLAGTARATDSTCHSTDACLKALVSAQANTRTIEARFVQTKYLALLDEPLVSTGRLRFRRPDRVRLDVETPRPATIVIAGDQVIIPGLPDSERRALAASPMAAMFRDLGVLFAGQLTKVSPHFTVEARAADDGIDVTLTPTAAGSERAVRRIALRFAGPHRVIRTMRIDEALGDRVEIELSDVRRDLDLPDSLFQLPGHTQ